MIILWLILGKIFSAVCLHFQRVLEFVYILNSSTGGQVTPVTITSCMITDDHFGEMPAGEMTYNTFSTSNLG